MEQNNWINEVFESTHGMHKAEPSPFLFEQITSKIKAGKSTSLYSSHGSNTLRWGLAVFVSVIISVNILVLIKSNLRSASAFTLTGSIKLNELNNATIYSY